ncbi:Hypothetical_protein [Hexamita inflata]|uniref:Hypothetical_protein n=1 Tax=Hexamita inflata TaxID=28002 RepID=A0AA86NBZ5_9EUKA|nr:Hypothetical protein HINF_LOCUS4572 [Hexamita inflata]
MQSGIKPLLSVYQLIYAIYVFHTSQHVVFRFCVNFESDKDSACNQGIDDEEADWADIQDPCARDGVVRVLLRDEFNVRGCDEQYSHKFARDLQALPVQDEYEQFDAERAHRATPAQPKHRVDSGERLLRIYLTRSFPRLQRQIHFEAHQLITIQQQFN